ncbi:MAG: cyclic pyranopterin monophosphate synthase MoaC [Paracoccus sp. (in: a-proteobacteria)]|nr:cyclic pyranopterin monophosphate synthase MoaC [Paracoccus sp. (in: a-proteobacteria)]
MSLSHFDADGSAHMVDVSTKPQTLREAVAEGFGHMAPETLRLVQGHAAKGDVLAVARIAGIMGAKRTSDLIPLCHPLSISKVALAFEILSDRPAIRVEAKVRSTGPTGVEMEALTAVGISCLTIYDMLKAADKAIRIDGIRLLEKTGGKSGPYRVAQ